MKKPGNTKARLLQVAFDLIWDSSYGSVSVEDICRRARVNKGSFYHFFKTKAELAIEAYRKRWEEMRPKYDQLFSPEIPPLQQIRGWCRHVYQVQRDQAKKYGHVCGCPYSSVGAELATQDEKIRASSEGLIYAGRKYVELAIADAVREGSVAATNPAVAARRAYSLCLGMLFEAKVQNNLKLLREIEPAIMGVLGIKQTKLASTSRITQSRKGNRK